MNEPTIYKPSIYNEPTVYNNGGGGGVNEIEIIENVFVPIVEINGILWTAENVNAYLSGIALNPENSDQTPQAYYYYRNIRNIGYGIEYNYNAAKMIGTAAADGWRLPTKSDFENLFSFVSNNPIKLNSKTTWDNGSNGTNETGFNAIASGCYRGWGNFSSYGSESYFCTSTENNSSTYFVASTNTTACVITTKYKEECCPIRLCKEA